MKEHSKSSKDNQQATSNNFGIEVAEVDFSEFDRRKTPRMSSYALFVKSLEATKVKMEFAV